MPKGKTKTRVPKKQVVVFMGLIASGKSFLAVAWAARHGCPYYNTDVMRKQIAGIAASESWPEGPGLGIYSPEYTRRTYEAVLAAAEERLRDDRVSCVALDGSYQAEAERDRVRRAFEGRARVMFVMCGCNEEVTKERLAKRAVDPSAVSDGRWEIYLAQKTSFQYPEELPFDQFRRLETDAPLEDLLERLEGLIQQGEECAGPPAQSL